ncbi:MAG: signal recognition particle-docking protein FtsY [Candidatus Micrarchaeota archaeon]|nr:signal recognition particle-docking protein FtsY [Candidatus Micrarchaeota archaeon]
MFGLLKDKLAGFIKGLTGREEKKETPQPQPQPVAESIPESEEKPLQEGKKSEKKSAEPPKKAEAPKKIDEQKKKEEPKKAEEQKKHVEISKPAPVAQKPIEAPKQHVPSPIAKPIEQPKPVHTPFEAPKPTVPAPQIQKPAPVAQKIVEAPKPIEAPKPAQHVDLSRLGKRASEEKHSMAPKIGLGMAIKSFFSSDVTIGEPEVADLLEGLELSLLEADVAYDVSLEVTSQLRQKLVGMKVPKGQIEQKTKETVQYVLESIMDSERKFDFLSRVKSTEKPVKILFVGPNGAGKTTTMAKLAHLFMANNLTVVFSASDTFRAAAVEQTEVHAERLGAKVIKSKYGADPSSVAFDAINFAKSHAIDIVLIDSAGRQDTNANLLSELKKMNRIAKPDLKIYIGESIGGNSVIEQIKAFNEAIGIDGAILTKIDCDAKGGTAISIAKSTGIPVLFLGMGQRYEDLVAFDPHKIAQEIMS